MPLQLGFKLPPRSVKQIASLKGKMSALVLGRVEEFEFTDLDKAKGVEQERGGVTVIMREVRKNEEIYDVKVKVGDNEQSQPLVLRKDPNSGGSEDEIRAQSAMAQDIAADLNSAVDMVNSLEVIRNQIMTLKASLGDDDKVKDVRDQSDSLDKKLIAVEEQLLQMRVTGRGQDLLRWPYKLGEQLVYLAQSVTGSDFGPTQQHGEVQRLLREELRKVKAQFDAVMSKDVEAFKQMLRAKNLQNVIISN